MRYLNDLMNKTTTERVLSQIGATEDTSYVVEVGSKFVGMDKLYRKSASLSIKVRPDRLDDMLKKSFPKDCYCQQRMG